MFTIEKRKSHYFIRRGKKDLCFSADRSLLQKIVTQANDDTTSNVEKIIDMLRSMGCSTDKPTGGKRYKLVGVWFDTQSPLIEQEGGGLYRKSSYPLFVLSLYIDLATDKIVRWDYDDEQYKQNALAGQWHHKLENILSV